MKMLAAGAIALALSTAAAAQTAPTSAVLQPAAETNMLRVGTPVALKMREELTTKGKKLKVGHRFNLEVAENLLVNGTTVIPAGTPAMGEVTEVRNKGMWGKSGRINARVLYLTVNGRQVRLSGQLDDKGTTGTAGVVAAVALMPVAGFLMTGTSATIPIGAPIRGFIDEDVPVAFAQTAVQPMTVAQPVAAPQ